MKIVRVRAYSSSANLGPGFDILALAHNAFYDEVWLRIKESGTGRIEIKTIEGPYSRNIPSEENTAKKAIELMIERYIENPKIDIEIGIWKGIPAGYGLGSSGASAAAAVKAFNEALNLNLDYNRLIEIAGIAEEVAAGSPHFDNVAASILGNLAVIYSFNPIKAFRLDVSARFIVVVPLIETINKKTMLMRKVIPSTVRLKDAVCNIASALALLTGLLKGDIRYIYEGFKDHLIEPHREPLIPCYGIVKRELAKVGIRNITLSGAGPSIIIPYISVETYRIVCSIVPKIYRRECNADVIIKLVTPAPGAYVTALS